MSYEVAQSVLDQLAIATEIFTAGYIGVNFVLYSWKRLGETPAAIAPTQPPLALPEAVATPLPELKEKKELETIPAGPLMEAYAAPNAAAYPPPIAPPLAPAPSPMPTLTPEEDAAVPFAEDEDEEEPVAVAVPPTPPELDAATTAIAPSVEAMETETAESKADSSQVDAGGH